MTIVVTLKEILFFCRIQSVNDDDHDQPHDQSHDDVDHDGSREPDTEPPPVAQHSQSVTSAGMGLTNCLKKFY